MSDKNYSILISYLIGAPAGIISVILFFFLPKIISGEGLLSMVLFGVFAKAIIGLIISFLIMLGFSGKNAFDNLSNGNSLLLSSFKYSLSINMIIWTVFMILAKLTNDEFNGWLSVLPIVGFLLCTIITTFTIGLFICYLIKSRLKKHYC